MTAELTVLNLGTVAYRPAAALQEQLVRRVQAQPDTAYLLLLEHDPPVVTLGRRRQDEHILASPSQLAAAGIEVHSTRRGGDVTYHGPGQLVGYLILNLRAMSLGVRRFVEKIEQALIDLLDTFELAPGRVDGLTGVWVAGEKIAAIGTAVSRGVTFHGFALNVSTNLSHFDFIVPCGLRQHRVTSLSAQVGRAVSVEQVQSPLAGSVAGAFGFELPRLVRLDTCAMPEDVR